MLCEQFHTLLLHIMIDSIINDKLCKVKQYFYCFIAHTFFVFMQ